MKNYVLLAAMAASVSMLSSCSSEDKIEDSNLVSKGAPIELGMKNANVTRASNLTGDDAAAALGGKFIAFGQKTVSSTPTNIFNSTSVDVNYTSPDWSYLKPETNPGDGDGQPLLYWDYSASGYDFYAYSDANSTSIVTATTPFTSGIAIKSSSADAVAKVYAAEKVSVAPANFGKAVNFVFKNAAAKVRVAFYEAVSGYKIQVNYFTADDTQDKVVFGGSFYSAAAYTIGTDGAQKLTGSTAATSLEFGDQIVAATTIGESINAATFDQTSGAYTWVLPTLNGTGANVGADITMKVNYTMTVVGGTEAITYTRDVVIPAEYAQWEPNHAYTYFFKITDSELSPITFTAEVVDFEENTQETITTIDGTATPNITTYVADSDVQTNKEYKVDDVIEVRVTNGTATALEVLYSATAVDENEAKALDYSSADDIASAGNFTPDAAGYYVIRATYAGGYVYKVVKVVA